MGTQRTLCSFIMGLGNFSMKINGAHCGIEAIVLGIVTNIGGFLFGYDRSNFWYAPFQRLQRPLWSTRTRRRRLSRPECRNRIHLGLPYEYWISSWCSFRCIHRGLVGTKMEYDLWCRSVHHWEHHSDHGYAVLGTYDDGTIRRWSWSW